MTTSNKETSGEKPITITIHGSEEMPLKLRQAIAEMVDAVLLWNKATRPVHQDAGEQGDLIRSKDEALTVTIAALRDVLNEDMNNKDDEIPPILEKAGQALALTPTIPNGNESSQARGVSGEEEQAAFDRWFLEQVDHFTSPEIRRGPANDDWIKFRAELDKRLAATFSAPSPPATAETEEIARDAAEQDAIKKRTVEIILAALARHSAAKDAEIAELKLDALHNEGIEDELREANKSYYAAQIELADLKESIASLSHPNCKMLLGDIAARDNKIAELKELLGRFLRGDLTTSAARAALTKQAKP